jgi:phospholipid/cholesterol/gamma-HCH transport system substrate-binding protein
VKISKEIKVALLGVVALVILYFGFTFLKGSNLFSDERTFYVIYDDVNGLAVSNPVILNGIRVGSVKDMELLTDQGNQIRVSLTVLEDIQIGDSTIANLASSDLLGGKSIVLTLGNSTKMFDSGEKLIPYKQTSITDMLSSKAVPVIDRADTTLARVNRILIDTESKKNVQDILENTKQMTDAVNLLIRTNQGNINAITANLSQLVRTLQTTQRNVDKLTLNMVQITDTLKQVEVNKLVNNANEAVRELEITLAKLNSDQSSIGRLINDDQLYVNMDRSTDALNLLLRDIQAHPKRYVSFSVFGKKDKYKVEPNGRIITIEEVKELQDENKEDFKKPASNTTKKPVKTDSAAIK